MTHRALVPLLLALIVAPAHAASAAKPSYPGLPRVEIDTSVGPIVIALETKRAPITSRNFLAYVDQKRFDDTSFYRAARATGNPKEGFVEGGVNNSLGRSLKPIAHEPTSLTGLRHVDGTVSMARDDPGTAMGDFFIVVGDGTYLDATRKDPGYAAFGHVISGMPVVRKMLAQPTYRGGWSKQTVGQSMVHPIRIIAAKRLP